MALSGAERVRNFHARRKVAANAAQRAAYTERKGSLAKVRTVAHFRRWAAQLRLDTGAHWKLEPFQEAFVRDLFAGRSENWLVVPEGNAKTTLVAGLGLYHLLFTTDADIAVAASARDQAGIIYRQAEGFIRRAQDDEVPDIKDLHLHPGYRRIEYALNRSRLQVFAADAATGDGIIPTLCLIDELHRHRDMRLYQTWRGKLVKRNGQLITISTAGEPGSEFEQTRELIRQDASAEVTRKDTFLRVATSNLVLHEWAVPEGGDIHDLRLVKRANPLRAMTRDKLQRKLAGPSMTTAYWRRFVCNIPSRGESAAITEAEWKAASENAPEIPAGESIWLGFDYAPKWDTTAMVPLWMKEPDERILGDASILLPPRDGSILNPELVEQAFLAVHQRNPIHTVVMDTSAGAGTFVGWIERELKATVVDRQQTNPQLVDDYNRFTEALSKGWLKHQDDPGLNRHVLNAVARLLPDGHARFDRPNPNRRGRDLDLRVIDALSAASMVHSVASAQPIDETSVYEERGVLVLA